MNELEGFLGSVPLGNNTSLTKHFLPLYNLKGETTMSKTTQRYGKPTQTFHLTISANPQPSKQVETEWRVLNGAARKGFNKGYFQLTKVEKITLHDALNSKPDGDPRNEPIDRELYQDLLTAGYVKRPVTTQKVIGGGK